MSSKYRFALLVAVVCLVAGPVTAQTDPPDDREKSEQEKTFQLQRESATAEAELELSEDQESFYKWYPTVDQGTVEVSFGLGFLNLNHTLLGHEQIIYKYTQEETFFGDVELKGKSSFNPVIRGGINVSRWFGLELQGGLSFGDYEASIDNQVKQKNEPGAPVVPAGPLGEFDAEKRSLLTGQFGLAAVVYPLNLAKERISHFHPYLTGGVGAFWYSMNSNYVDGPARGLDTIAGLGLRILGDRNVSVRFEALMHFHKLEWDVPEFFTVRDEGTVRVPLEDSTRTPVTDYGTSNMTLLNWSIGIQGTF